jgi:hypothetical protein
MSADMQGLATLGSWDARAAKQSDVELQTSAIWLLGASDALTELQAMADQPGALEALLFNLTSAKLAVSDELRRRKAETATAGTTPLH